MKRSRRAVLIVVSCAAAVLLASRGTTTGADDEHAHRAAEPVRVVNTPTVNAQQKGPWDVSINGVPNVTVSNFPATQNVNVTNPTFQAPQPFHAKVELQLPSGLCCDNAFVDVPAGKLLVIEYASAWAFANGNQTFQFEVGTQLSGEVSATTHYLPVKQRVFDGNSNEIAGQEVKLYADAGPSHVMLRASHSNDQTAATIFMTISGHLVDR